jgi:hypothetical protein
MVFPFQVLVNVFSVNANLGCLPHPYFSNSTAHTVGSGCFNGCSEREETRRPLQWVEDVDFAL